MPHDHHHDHDDHHHQGEAGHAHSPGPGHAHHHAPANFNKAFAIGIALNAIFVLVEGGVGFSIKSLALVADAGHNLSDVVSLLLAWAASYWSRSRPTKRHTYGYRSSTILVSLVNAVILLIAIGAIAWEAIQRFTEPTQIPGGPIMIVAAIGIVINAATALLFMSGRKDDLNIKGAFLHMAADAGVSVGVVGAGLAIQLTGRHWIDPAVSLGIVAVIAVGTWGLLRDSVNLALNAVPEGIDYDAVQQYLAALPGVREVHDLHIWAMSTTQVALTAHLVMPKAPDGDAFLHRTTTELHEQHRIEHPTLQIERGDTPHDCKLAPADKV
jgi:cobalt-zinc-cadmium efflux system protein